MSRALALLALLLGVAHAGPQPVALTPDAALEKARVSGKYKMLLRQVRAPDDHERYGAFTDYGPYPALQEYRGEKDLPAGYWVYVYPTWYIWRDLATKKWRRPWGPEQATGAPDSAAGDRRTAWASRTEDGADEWLLLEYARPVRPLALVVYENHHPGALKKVTVFRSDGAEVVVWEGKDPVRGGIALIPVRADFRVLRVKLHLASKAVKGWNEIDAVGLLDDRGRTHWATAAHASSFYGPTPIRRLPRPILRPKPIKVPMPFCRAPKPTVIPTPFRWVPDAGETRRLRRELDELERRVAELEKKAAK
jgi:hypothetical protein